MIISAKTAGISPPSLRYGEEMATALQPPRSRQAPVLATGALALACLYVGALDPSHSNAYPACPFHAVTGLWCPGCGATRAAHALLHGNVRAAMGFNVLLVLALPFAAYSYATWALGGRVAQLRLSPRVTWVLLSVAVVFGVARNLAPFQALAP